MFYQAAVHKILSPYPISWAPFKSNSPEFHVKAFYITSYIVIIPSSLAANPRWLRPEVRDQRVGQYIHLDPSNQRRHLCALHTGKPRRRAQEGDRGCSGLYLIYYCTYYINEYSALDTKFQNQVSKYHVILYMQQKFLL